jgi:predicted O-linked N-acetylglucosamine transferase (SPINDLY family)
MTPGVYESLEHINATRALLTERIDQISDPVASYALKGLDEFTMSPTFYFVYQGHNDRDLLQKLQHAYIQAHPKLGEIAITANVERQAYLYQHERVLARGVGATGTPTGVTQSPSAFPRKIRVGFVSSHFRRHSICKLFCGVMTHLNPDLYEVFAFSSLQQNREDAVTQSLRESHVHYVPIGMTFIQNRNEVTDRAIDILVRNLMPRS